MDDQKAKQSQNKLFSNKVGIACFIFITVFLLIAGIKLTKEVTLPLVIGILLTFVLNPLVSTLEKIKIPRAIGSVIVVLLIGIAVYGVSLILYSSMKTVLTLYPKYEDRFTEIYVLIANAFSLPYDEHLSLFQNLWSQLKIREQVQNYVFSFSGSVASLLSDAMMVILFVIFLLLEFGHFQKRIELAFQEKFSDKIKIVLAATVTQVSRYLSTKFWISLATGLVTWGGLSLVGVDFPVIWAVMAFIMNFIPNIGSILISVLVTIFALVQFWPHPGPIIAAFCVMLGENMILGNILEPRIQGQSLGLSPFVILASLSIWGWLWGFAGLVLAVPMTVIIKITCENIPGLESVSIMMSSYKDVKKHHHFYLKQGK